MLSARTVAASFAEGVFAQVQANRSIRAQKATHQLIQNIVNKNRLLYTRNLSKAESEDLKSLFGSWSKERDLIENHEFSGQELCISKDLRASFEKIRVVGHTLNAHIATVRKIRTKVPLNLLAISIGFAGAALVFPYLAIPAVAIAALAALAFCVCYGISLIYKRVNVDALKSQLAIADDEAKILYLESRDSSNAIPVATVLGNQAEKIVQGVPVDELESPSRAKQ